MNQRHLCIQKSFGLTFHRADVFHSFSKPLVDPTKQLSMAGVEKRSLVSLNQVLNLALQTKIRKFHSDEFVTAF